MPHAHLRPCPACDRHARVSEEVCPFCGAEFSAAFRASPQPQGPAARLSRAALIAFGALGTGSLAVAPGCSSSSSSSPPTVYPLYGITPMGDAGADDGSAADASSEAAPGTDASVDAGSDAPMAQPAYGIAVPIRDASDEHVGVTPLYGVAPGNG